MNKSTVKVLGLIAGIVVLGLLLRATGFIGLVLGAWICLMAYIVYQDRRLN